MFIRPPKVTYVHMASVVSIFFCKCRSNLSKKHVIGESRFVSEMSIDIFHAQICGSLCKAFSLSMRTDIIWQWKFALHLVRNCSFTAVLQNFTGELQLFQSFGNFAKRWKIPSCRFYMRFFLTNVLRWLTKVWEKGAWCIATLLTIKLFCTQNVVNVTALMWYRPCFSVLLRN